MRSQVRSRPSKQVVANCIATVSLRYRASYTQRDESLAETRTGTPAKLSACADFCGRPHSLDHSLLSLTKQWVLLFPAPLLFYVRRLESYKLLIDFAHYVGHTL